MTSKCVTGRPGQKMNQNVHITWAKCKQYAINRQTKMQTKMQTNMQKYANKYANKYAKICKQRCKQICKQKMQTIMVPLPGIEPGPPG